ncbi:hypothetical protein ABU549_001051 [Yersinia enterocolitica]
MNNIEELKKAALGANLHGWTGFEDALNDDGYSEAVSKFIGHCSPSAILALIAQLEAKNIRADACVNAFEGIETERFAGKSIGEFLAGEVRLNKAEPKPDGSFGFTFSGLAIQIMAESFADQFKSSGAVNYLELLFDHSEVGPLTVTMQRVDGLTPAQKLATAEAALSAANEKLSKPVVLPPRRSASYFVDEEFSNEDLAAIYNAARLEFSVKVKNAGFTAEGE